MNNYNNDLDDDSYKTGKIAETYSEFILPVGQYGPFIAKLPVVISKVRININVESTVQLDRFAASIGDTSDNVFFNWSKLFYQGKKKPGKLYLNGYIKEKIEYIEADEKNRQHADGRIRFISVKIPFECSARVDYFCPPSVRESEGLLPVKLQGAGIHPDEAYNFSYGEANNEEIYCELETVNALDKNLVGQSPLTDEECIDTKFDTISIGMTVSVTLILFQKKLVYIKHS